MQRGTLSSIVPTSRAQVAMPEKRKQQGHTFETDGRLSPPAWGIRTLKTEAIRTAFDQDLQKAKAYRAMMKQVEQFKQSTPDWSRSSLHRTYGCSEGVQPGTITRGGSDVEVPPSTIV